jgi:hypothetical protein
MNVTLEQVQEAAKTDPELKKGLISSFTNDFMQAPPENVVIRTKEQDQQYLDNQLSVLLPGKLKQEFRVKMDEIDGELETLTGLKKGPHEKTTEFVKRALSETSAAKGGDAATKARVQELENLITTKENEFTQTLSKKDQEIFNKELAWQVDAELNRVNIAVPIHLKTDAEKQQYINKQKALIKQGFLSSYEAKKDSEGNIIFYEGDKPLMSTKDGKPKAAGDIISENYASWFTPSQHTVTGTGTGTGGSNGVAGGAFTTRQQVHDHLKATGFDPEVDDEKYRVQFEKLCKEQGIAI